MSKSPDMDRDGFDGIYYRQAPKLNDNVEADIPTVVNEDIDPSGSEVPFAFVSDADTVGHSSNLGYIGGIAGVIALAIGAYAFFLMETGKDSEEISDDVNILSRPSIRSLREPGSAEITKEAVEVVEKEVETVENVASSKDEGLLAKLSPSPESTEDQITFDPEETSPTIKAPVPRSSEQAAFTEAADKPNPNIQIADTEFTVRFAFDAVKLSETETAKITELVNYALQCRHDLVIIGHTCHFGSPDVNFFVGLARAKATRGFLTSYGIAYERITVRSAGENEPVASNESWLGRAENRRAVLRCTKNVNVGLKRGV